MKYYCNNQKYFRRFLQAMGCFILLCCMGVVLSQSATAAIAPGSPFTCSGGTPSGNLFTTMTDSGSNVNAATAVNACSTGGVYTRVLCIFNSTVGQAMSAMYCSVQEALAQPISIMLTLVVIIFGIGITTGMNHFTIKNTMIMFFKIALVYLFATQAEFGIGIAYKFFMGVAGGGADIVLGVLSPGGAAAAGSPSSINYPDSVIANVMGLITADSTNATPAFHTATSGNGSTLSNASPYCQSIIASIALALLYNMPVILVFIITTIIMYAGMYARALLAYLSAVVLISFLFIVAPIFLSFALFKTTQKLFEQWIKHLTSYTVQIIITFGILAMIGLVVAQVGGFFFNLSGLLTEYNDTASVSAFTASRHSCGICEYTPVPTPPAWDPTDTAKSQIPITTTALVCMSPAYPPITPTTGMPGGTPLPPSAVISADGQRYVYSLWNMMEKYDFVIFLVTRCIAFWVIGLVLSDFLEKAPEFAKELGGLPFAAALSGSPAANTPGIKINYIGLESIEAGFANFKSQLSKNTGLRPKWGERITSSLKAGVDGFLHGSNNLSNTELAELQKVEYRRDVMRKELEKVQNLKLKNQKLMQDALHELKTIPATDLVALQAARTRLESASRNSAIAAGNEPLIQRNLTAADYAVMQAKQGRQKLRGILGRRDETGKFIQESSLDSAGHLRGDDVTQLLARKRSERRQVEEYGHVLKEGGLLGKNMYGGFLKMPSDIGAGEAPLSPVDLKSEATTLIDGLQAQLQAAPYLFQPHQVQQIEGVMAKARNDLAAARYPAQYAPVIQRLESVQRQFIRGGGVSSMLPGFNNLQAADDTVNSWDDDSQPQSSAGPGYSPTGQDSSSSAPAANSYADLIGAGVTADSIGQAGAMSDVSGQPSSADAGVWAPPAHLHSNVAGALQDLKSRVSMAMAQNSLPQDQLDLFNGKLQSIEGELANAKSDEDYNSLLSKLALMGQSLI